MHRAPLLLLLLLPLASMGQQRAVRDSVLQLFGTIRSGDADSKQQASDAAEALLLRHFSDRAHFARPLDSVPFLGQLVSDDGRVMLLCWNLLLDGGALRYHCIVLHRPYPKATVASFVLRHSDADWDRIGRKALRPEEWYGALYYRILTHRHKKTTYYTLLGWDGQDAITNRKMVDALSLKGDGMVLGAPMFVHDKRPAHRLIYRYAKDATMSLNWDTRKKMIVMDHLAPDDSRMKGQFQFYGPDFSYDGLRFEKGKWVLVEDINATNRGLNNLE